MSLIYSFIIILNSQKGIDLGVSVYSLKKIIQGFPNLHDQRKQKLQGIIATAFLIK